MRLTVKVKLAGAFGIVIALTGIVGAVGIERLSTLNGTIDNLVLRRAQMQRLAEELSVHTLRGIRAEKNAIISSDEAEMAGLAKDIIAERASAHEAMKSLDAFAEPSTVDQIKKIEEIAVRYGRIQDQTVNFTMMNSNYKAHDASQKLRLAKAKAVDDLRPLIEGSQDPIVLKTLSNLRFSLLNLWSDTQTSITAGSMSELAEINQQIETNKTAFKKTLAEARDTLKARNIAGSAVLDALVAVVTGNDEIVRLNSGGGNIQAGNLSCGDGAKISNELMVAIGKLVEQVGSQLEADRNEALGSYEQARQS